MSEPIPQVALDIALAAVERLRAGGATLVVLKAGPLVLKAAYGQAAAAAPAPAQPSGPAPRKRTPKTYKERLFGHLPKGAP